MCSEDRWIEAWSEEGNNYLLSVKYALEKPRRL
jgi:hypothetical protein